ncbi:MAG: tRNA threonylcarbamoyladenosine dehydratase [Clostridia bacterium]|nr:tRNA threonylcarbamoyladenosine dehydratase [Clostridia bacterium]
MQFSRTSLLIGQKGVEKLKNARVAVFGIGGVGGFVVEALARSGVGAIDLIDKDVVSESNLNRQIIALHSTIGRLKTDVMAERVKDISPNTAVKTHNVFYLPETATQFDFSEYDYVVDAIDTVSGKIALIENAKRCNTPIISSMGTGNKLDATAFEVADISKTSVCPLARVMRRELKKRGIEHVKVLYSKEEPLPSQLKDEESGKPIPGSIAFVPSVAGLMIAGEVIKDLMKK